MSKKTNNKKQLGKKIFQTVTGGKGNKPFPSAGGNKIVNTSQPSRMVQGRFETTGSNLTTRRNALGRGLQALLAPTAIPAEPLQLQTESITTPPVIENLEVVNQSIIQATSSVTEKHENDVVVQKESKEFENRDSGLIYAPVEIAVPNKNQPRQNFSETELESLTQSIKTTGMLQPIIVRKIEEAVDFPRYEIVAGERRWRAAQRAGLTTVPMLIRNLSDKEVLEIGIVENVQRSDLNAIEEAIAYQRLIDEFDQTQENVATAVGKDRTSIANSLRLLKLPGEVQGMLAEGKLSAGHGRALLKLSNIQAQKTLANKIISEGLSVRTAEKLCDERINGIVEEKDGSKIVPLIKQKTPQVIEIENRLRRVLGTKVNLSISPSGIGELKVSFFSNAELDNLLERLEA